MQRGAGALSLGRRLHPLLPEDAFDRGVLNRGPHWLVADVRLDNRGELARALNIGATEARRLADSALLFECLLKWGEDALPRLTGEFALAFWNDEQEELLLARDIFGKRPLYFHRTPQFLAFASMPSGLHALPEIPREFDSGFVAESLALLPWEGSKSWFRDVERVEPANLLRVTRASLSSSCYWSPSRADRVASPAEYEQGLRAVLDEAVRAQLRGAGDAVGSHLSSGLDSSTVTATAAREFPPGKVVAFTAVPRSGFDGPVPKGTFADESPLAARTAGLYSNIEHVLVDTSADPLIEPLDREHYFQQQPIVNICNARWSRAINRLAHERGLKVVLTGAAGNMSITYGGLEWISHLLDRGRLIEAARLFGQLVRNGTPWTTIAAQIAGPLLPLPLWRIALRLRGRVAGIGEVGAVNSRLLAELERKARECRMDLAFRPSRKPNERRMWALAREDGGNYFKGVLAQWGVSLRDPTADKRVVEYCLSVPSSELVRGGMARSLAKRAFADRLPNAVIGEPRRGHQSADWYEAVGRELPQLRDEIAAFARCDGMQDSLDLGWLDGTASSWPSKDWARGENEMRYRWGLLRAVSAGHFMRKVAGSN